jgi:hypothetical protein
MQEDRKAAQKFEKEMRKRLNFLGTHTEGNALRDALQFIKDKKLYIVKQLKKDFIFYSRITRSYHLFSDEWSTFTDNLTNCVPPSKTLNINAVKYPVCDNKKTQYKKSYLNQILEVKTKMDQKSLDEHIEKLEELIRTASKHLPSEAEYTEDDIGALIKKDVRDRLYGKHPECFVSLKRMGREPFFLPICNRKAIVDPKAIKISMSVVQRMMASKGSGDVNELQSVFDKLQKMANRYGADIPKPPKAAARKAVVTKLMNKMGRYIQVIKPKDDEYKD